MNNEIIEEIKSFYDKYSLRVSEFEMESEGKEYSACRYKLNGLIIISRVAKITPKKTGQFVTFWRRNKNGITEPFNENDTFDFYVINVRSENKIGQFVIPKSTLIEKGIISTRLKDGKRGFRVYPSWDIVNNKQAEKTQEWQLNYFIEIDDRIDSELVNKFYHLNYANSFDNNARESIDTKQT